MRSHEGEGPKQFKVGFRGYRREPVDEYVERLHQWLVDSEARADQAVEVATAAVGERASEILRAAMAVGTQANEEADALKAAAVENAHAEAERMMKDAHRQIEALQQSIDQLAVRRANVVSELGRLQKYLAAAAGVPRDLDLGEDTELDAVLSAEPDPQPASKNGDRQASKSS
jgi:cell division septum initiation protein DivIVA